MNEFTTMFLIFLWIFLAMLLILAGAVAITCIVRWLIRKGLL